MKIFFSSVLSTSLNRNLSLFIWALSCITDKFLGLSFVYTSLIIVFYEFISLHGERSFFSLSFYPSKISTQQYLFLCAIIVCGLYTIVLSSDIIDSLKYMFYAFFFLFTTIRLRETFFRDASNSSYSQSLSLFLGFLHSYVKQVTFIGYSISAFLLFFGIQTRPGNYNPLSYSTDPNMMAFISCFFFAIALFNRSKILAVFLSLAVLYSGSRTSILILFTFILVYIVVPYLYKLVICHKFSKIFLWFMSGFLSVITLLLVFNPALSARGGFRDVLFDGIQSAMALTNTISVDDVDELPDLERFKLKQSNLDFLASTNWVPQGFGLKNYQEKLRPFAELSNVRDARAHNFYISYFVEYGFAFVLLLSILVISSFKFISPRHQASLRLLSSLSLAFAFGLLFNEYFYNPVVLAVLLL